MRRNTLALGAAIALTLASVTNVAAAGGNGRSYCSWAGGPDTGNPGLAAHHYLLQVPPGPPSPIGADIPGQAVSGVTAADCNPNADPF